MQALVRHLLSVLLLVVAAAAFGRQDGLQMVRGKEVVTVHGVFNAHYIGKRTREGKESSQVVVSLTRSELRGYDLSDPKDAGNWWLLKGAQNNQGTLSPYPKALPNHPAKVSTTKTVDVYTLDVDPQALGLVDGDSLLVFIAARRSGALDNEAVVLNEMGLNMVVTRPAETDSITVGGLSVAPNAQLENGSTAFVVHATLTYDQPDVRAQLGWARLHFISTNVLSTQTEDENAYFSGMLLAEKIKQLEQLLPSFPLSPFVRMDTSESFHNQSANFGVIGKVRLRGTRFGMGDTFDSVKDAMLYFVPIQFQDRYHRTGYIAPWDTRANILVSSANILWEPIFLGSSKDVPDINSDYSLHLGGNLWYFPDRGSAPGVET
ncbi:MAG: hypothetical protein P4L46_07720, partial [Fimbriimonas sp.]|nr:hypothetical protein [Fimbriimonas sp.]